MSTRTFIYGSCVSRDTFEHLPTADFTLVQYVARQSLVSACTPAAAGVPPDFHTSSDFQRRMLLGDWESNLIPLLRKHAHEVDLLLWDLCDERLGIREVQLVSRRPPVHAVATRSVDGIRAGLDEQLRRSRLVPFASLRHRLLFLRCLHGFVQELATIGLLEKTLLLAPAWARATVDGYPVPTSFGVPTHRANRLFDDYYRTIQHVAPTLKVVNLGPEAVTSDPDHPWGLAPFHYSEDVYAALTTQVTGLAGR